MKNYTYGQSDLTVDLLNNPDLLAKFIRLKGWKLKKFSIKLWLIRLSLYFRTTEPVDVNKFQKLILKLLILTLICIDWYITYCIATISMFHSKFVANSIIVLWMTTPNFLPSLWSMLSQLLYVDSHF